MKTGINFKRKKEAIGQEKEENYEQLWATMKHFIANMHFAKKYETSMKSLIVFP